MVESGPNSSYYPLRTQRPIKWAELEESMPDTLILKLRAEVYFDSFVLHSDEFDLKKL